MKQEEYGMWLCSIEGIGSTAIRKLIDEFGTPEEIYKKTEEQFINSGVVSTREAKMLINSKRQFRYRAMREKIVSYNMQMASYFSEQYPERLRQIPDFPKKIYWKGELPQEEVRIAIVGARNCSHYGRETARRFGRELAGEGIGIISGMARGTDGWAHQGALEGGGNTYAVLGNSAEICYPKEHRRLYDSILKQGGILSEYPPETPAMPGFFPMRNRLISALSDGVLVVEARQKSGSLITADQALEQGKDIFVIPGRIGDTLSEGCNQLIRQGAFLVTKPADIVEYYETNGVIARRKRTKKLAKIKVSLESEEKMVYASLSLEPKDINCIAKETLLPVTTLVRQLFSLQKRGLVKEIGKNNYIKI